MSEKLYGNVTYDSDIEYEWVTEAGACEKCRALDGKRFQHSDEIPDRPHPNCKCWIKVHMTYKDPLKNLRETRIKTKHEQEKLEGDIRTLVEEIDANIEYLEIKESILYRFEGLHPYLDEGERSNLEENKVMISNKIKELKDYKNFILHGTANEQHSIDLLAKGIQGVGIALKNSGKLWNIAYTKFENYKDENSRFIGHPKYIKDETLKNRIIEKLKSQNMALASRGVYFNSNSDVAKRLVRTLEIGQYLLKFRKYFKDNKLPDGSISFNISVDEYFGFHNVDIFDITLENDNILQAKILDTYDFNKNDKNPLVKKAREYQIKGKIEPYYTIIDIKIKIPKWILSLIK